MFIHDIRFKGKRSINWDDVEAYLKQYIEEFFEVIETGDAILLGKICQMNLQAQKILHDLEEQKETSTPPSYSK